MKIPEHWLEGTTNAGVKWHRDLTEYTLELRRTYWNKGWFGDLKLKEEVLTSTKFNIRRYLEDEEVKQTGFYRDLEKIAIEIKSKINQPENKINWRQKALDCLTSSSIAEKDNFLSEFIEDLDSRA